MRTRLHLHVYGDPRPQGSKRHVGRGIMIESGGAALKTWREDVKQAALAHMTHIDPLSGPIEITVAFSLRRPMSHFVGNDRVRGLRKTAPLYHTGRPDVDKLLRSTLDALTSAGVYADDSLISLVMATKTWCDEDEPPGADITLAELTDVHTPVTM